LRAHVGGRQVHTHTFPAALPVGVRKKASQNLGIKIALAIEIAVKAPVRQTGACHNLLDRYVLETMAIELSARTFDDLPLDFLAVASGIRHASSSMVVPGSMPRALGSCLVKYYFEHILNSCFHADAAASPQNN